MAHRLHQPLRGLRNSLRPPPIHPSQKRAFSFPSRPPPPPPAAARRVSSSSLPLSALRSLAQHIVSSSKRYFSSQPAGGARASLKHKHLPQDMASRMRTLAGTMPGGGFHSSASGARFGPGGLGRGPMGPGVRGAFSRGVGNVGLGSARNYASMSRPLFDGIIGNTPLTLRALANGLEDQADNLKKRRHRSLHHHKPSTASPSARAAAHPYLKPSKKAAATTATFSIVEETTAEAHAVFFAPTEAQTLPEALSPSTTTTLFLPFSLASTTFFPPTDTLHGLTTSHREAYIAHATRVEGLIRTMEDRGVFLDPGVKEEEVKDWQGEEVLGIKVVFAGRNEEEVRAVLGVDAAGGERGEGEWWFLNSEDDATARSFNASPTVSTLVYPTIPMLVTPSDIFTSASNSLFEGNVLEERAEWSDASSRSLSYDDETPDTPLSSLSASIISEFEEDEDVDDLDGDWLSEVGSHSASSSMSSSHSASLGASFLLAEEREEVGTDWFSSAYWSEMGGSGMEMR